MATVLVIGATGYVGGRLVPRLLEKGHSVRCLARDARKVAGKDWADKVAVFEGDVLKPETLPDAFRSVDVVYYLVHSMGSGEKVFEQLDRRAAAHVATIAEASKVSRIVYLGGLGKRSPDQSPHLRSRHEVGDTLRSGAVPVTELRAAVIVGSGSASFEMIHHLVNRLPVMICPRWVYTRTQPIAIRDVLRYLVDSIEIPETSGRIIDIGGPEVLTYRDMMLTVAQALGLRRTLIEVPVLTPRLSSYWVNLVTPISTSIARSLIESLRHETICENHDARRLFAFEPLDLKKALDYTLARIRSRQVETAWTDASGATDGQPIDPSHLKSDRRTVEVETDAVALFRAVSSIGGDTGWYYADWLWKLRGFLDKQFGGVGLRRGRRHPQLIAVGDALDFWRVEEYLPHRRLLLRAEMKVWGQAWLEFEVEPLSPDAPTSGRARLTQTARYYPRGLFGLLYWYSVYPLHALVFRGMVRNIGREAENTRYNQTGKEQDTQG